MMILHDCSFKELFALWIHSNFAKGIVIDWLVVFLKFR